MNPLLAVSDLRVCFDGGVEALRGVSLELERGESLSIVGETGSGKSTLALCLAGLIQPPMATGSVRLDDTELLDAEHEGLRQLRPPAGRRHGRRDAASPRGARPVPLHRRDRRRRPAQKR